jgi:hypothetical protein
VDLAVKEPFLTPHSAAFQNVMLAHLVKHVMEVVLLLFHVLLLIFPIVFLALPGANCLLQVVLLAAP